MSETDPPPSPFADPRFGFIVGAPRSGTTSLARWLRTHPEVCFSSTKEPHYFAQVDLRGADETALRARVEREYLERFFAGCEPGKLKMEGSVTYLYAAEQVAAVLRLWPETRFIICVRDPLAMIPSLHQRLLYLGDETVEDFATAWALRHRRARGEAIPRSCVEPRWLRYDEGGRLGTHLEHFFAAVGRERCHVVVFDDLAADPAEEYAKVLRFLGLPDDGRTDFSTARAGYAYRIGWLQRLLKRPPVLTRRALAGSAMREHLKAPDEGGSKPKAGKQPSRVMRARKRLLRWNRVPARKTQVPPEIVAEFQWLYAGEVEKLERLLGRKLSHWLGRGQR
uniref:sulfotransferase family protein n=1 Tax=uncultured Sphingomonas sp. TaxID=158754 RepID=UPI0025E5BE0B|nr:sulfotransferase [uncultured Sphingomonas sp.]